MSNPRLFKQFFSLGGSQITCTAAPVTTVAPYTTPAINLPTSTILVTSTAGFTSTGTINVVTYIQNNNQNINNTITYTGITGSSFTGCSGGTGILFAGTVITQLSVSASSSWTAPRGVKWVWVTGCGGGGGGGSGASVSSTNNAYPLFQEVIAGGGGGGQAAPTNTHVVSVIPGTTYPISIGLGGVGGTVNGVWNGAPYSGPAVFPNNYGGASWGNAGSNGQSTVFGSVIFPGAQGGRRGEILPRIFAWNEIKYATFNGIGNFGGGDDPIGSTQFAGGTPFPNPVLGGQVVQNRSYGIWNPPGIATSSFTLDQVLSIGGLNNSQSLVANSAPAGLSNQWTGGAGGSGGGGGGGSSNNMYSTGGSGGQGAQGFAGYPFSTGGNNGIYGGGGGGGGGGEGVNYNNTHSGSPGGNGGSGFIEIAWIQ